ncbi:granzyme B isoform X3 [Scophthalmus maximus]|uniref:granzyme B isoform X2 n=1 Tax=Scophthalmus maximus TaxID=52904 RepID=UPI0015E08F95|nr:granzyme B isoform X2 [Scophthalmus maximus]XP_035504315.1 granzyme B isoform X3 [Scophthalmus maximus]
MISKGHTCGGFLVSEDFVVTAAHCDEDGPMSVVLGTHNLKKVNDAMRYDVKRCKYPSYVNITSGDDIMLLKLSRKAQLNDKVQTIRLPRTNDKIKEKQKCRVAGWGCNKRGGKVVDVLQVAEVPIVKLEMCKKQWKKTKFDLPANVTCAGGPNKGFCQGDSGGPLVCSGTAVGIVSFQNSVEYEHQRLPNVYTDLSKYLHWIKGILKKKNC